jgi:hypothetical protein
MLGRSDPYARKKSPGAIPPAQHHCEHHAPTQAPTLSTRVPPKIYRLYKYAKAYTHIFALNMPQAQPELKKVSSQRRFKLPLPNLHKYLEKRVLVQLNGSRKVMGILRGYDVRILPGPNAREQS